MVNSFNLLCSLSCLELRTNFGFFINTEGRDISLSSIPVPLSLPEMHSFSVFLQYEHYLSSGSTYIIFGVMQSEPVGPLPMVEKSISHSDGTITSTLTAVGEPHSPICHGDALCAGTHFMYLDQECLRKVTELPLNITLSDSSNSI